MKYFNASGTTNPDGSVDVDNGNGTYTETEKNGTVTIYTNNGIAFNPATDSIVLDSKGIVTVHTDLGNGSYLETEQDGSQTTYDSAGNVIGKGTGGKVKGAVAPNNTMLYLGIGGLVVVAIVVAIEYIKLKNK